MHDWVTPRGSGTTFCVYHVNNGSKALWAEAYSKITFTSSGICEKCVRHISSDSYSYSYALN